MRDVSKLLWKSTCEYKYLSISALPRDVEPMLSDTLSDMAVLPHRDKYGRRIIVYKMWDAEKWPYKKGMEAFYAINLLLSREAKTQVAGITMIGDFSGMSRKHMSTNMEDIRAWSNLISVRPIITYIARIRRAGGHFWPTEINGSKHMHLRYKKIENWLKYFWHS